MSLTSLSSPARRLAALALLPLVGTAALVAAAPNAQAVDTSSPVVISEVYGGGGNGGATFTNDFIELYNNGTTAVDLSDLVGAVRVVHRTSSCQLTDPDGVCRGEVLLPGSGGAGRRRHDALPTPNAIGTIAHECHGRKGGAREQADAR